MAPTLTTVTAGTNFSFSWAMLASSTGAGRAPWMLLSASTTASASGLPLRSSTVTVRSAACAANGTTQARKTEARRSARMRASVTACLHWRHE
ncbi:MAG: hypothetical protein EOP35_21835 [Rubrivivax sp.]|nr:MAG: hypothetical protein EOP35_21835 [Rubrivivax sp.]